MYNNVLNNNMPPPAWQQAAPPTILAQPPFMPPNVVGYMPPPPPVAPQPSLYDCESFPYKPNNFSSSWQQYAVNSNPPMVPPTLQNCESFPYNSNNQNYRWKQKDQYSQHYSSYDSANYTTNNMTKQRKGNFIDYCDVCDRGFKTEEKKRQHYDEHTKCTEPGCNFEAHFKIVEFHRKNLHGNGFRIQLSTPEDIKKWREERKKNFPTEKRVKQKQLDLQQQREAGAVLEEQSFRNRGHWNGRGRGRGRGRFFNRRGTHSNSFRHHPYANNKENTYRSQDDQNENNKDLTNEARSSDTDNANQTSLSQLISNYKSDDENNSENDATKDIPDKSFNENDSEKKTFHKTFHNHHKNRGNQHKKFSSALNRPSLLRMLLEPEIRRERNDILQCVRYVVDNNFFKEK